MMHSLIVADEHGALLTNCIIWADNRAAGIAEKLRHTAAGQQLYEATGVPIHAMSPFCKMLWLKEQEPEIFNAGNKFIGIKEYIFFKLFGTYIIDTALASATGLLNSCSLQWEAAALEMLDISVGQLSAIVPVEQVLYYDEKESGRPLLRYCNGIPFIIGSSDGALANLGTGSVANHSMSVTIGTSAALRMLTRQPATQPDMRTFCYHAIDDYYIIGGASNNGAVVLQWLKDSLLQTTATYPELFTLAESIPAGSNGLLFIPYILGERAPVWNANAKGVFFGLSIHHTKAHLIRAVLEGVIYNVYSIGKHITQAAPQQQCMLPAVLHKVLYGCRYWQMFLIVPWLVSGTQESSALGAVMVGIKALHLPIEIKPGNCISTPTSFS